MDSGSSLRSDMAQQALSLSFTFSMWAAVAALVLGVCAAQQQFFQTDYFQGASCSSLVMQIFVQWNAPQCPALGCLARGDTSSTLAVGCTSDPGSHVALKAQFQIFGQEGCGGDLTTMSALLTDQCFVSGRNSSQMVHCAADGGVLQTMYSNSTTCRHLQAHVARPVSPGVWRQHYWVVQHDDGCI
jgi:hypothetical protein